MLVGRSSLKSLRIMVWKLWGRVWCPSQRYGARRGVVCHCSSLDGVDHIAYLRRREDERAILAFFAWERKVLHVAFDSCVGGTHSWHVELPFGILGLEDAISQRAARACRPFSELQSAMQGTDEDTSALKVDLLAVGGGQPRAVCL